MQNGVHEIGFLPAKNQNGNDRIYNVNKIDGYSENPRFKKSRSMLEFSASNSLVSQFGKNERKVLVIYTGGTIGMMPNKEDGCKCILIIRYDNFKEVSIEFVILLK